MCCNQIAEENADCLMFYVSEENEHTVYPFLLLRISDNKNAENISRLQ